MNEVCGRLEEGEGAIAWFISPHGYGHAARASAVIAACSAEQPDIRHHLFTSVVRNFFDDSLAGVDFEYHHLECDVGMIQNTPFVEDVEGTIRALDRLKLDGGPEFSAVIAETVATGCRLIVSDIAPLGLAIADRLAIPGVLVENFTWDWIYRAYRDSRLDRHGERLAAAFRSATLRIQAEPACQRAVGAHVVAPISRSRRRSRTAVRSELGIRDDQRMVLMGVTGLEPRDLGRQTPSAVFVVPGPVSQVSADEGVIRIPTMGGPYHPDLVAASDLVVAKLGYSTVAEVFHGGTAFAYLRRPHFPEIPILETFVRENIPSAPLPVNRLDFPTASRIIEDLLDAPRRTDARANGAEDAAHLILQGLKG